MFVLCIYIICTICRCFTGGVGAVQSSPYRVGAANVVKELGGHNISFEELNISILRRSKWTIAKVVDWLLGAHIHFITCHPHMHMDKLIPSIDKLYREVGRLKYHPGFPSSVHLACPIWRQDKYMYLSALPSSHILPTYPIPLSRNMDMLKTKTAIDRYSRRFCIHRFVLLVGDIACSLVRLFACLLVCLFACRLVGLLVCWLVFLFACLLVRLFLRPNLPCHTSICQIYL